MSVFESLVLLSDSRNRWQGPEYPEKPPRVRFTSEHLLEIGERQHAGVGGATCGPVSSWQLAAEARTKTLAQASLLTDPNPASPANPEAAQLYSHDLTAYNRRQGSSVLDGVQQATTLCDRHMAQSLTVGLSAVALEWKLHEGSSVCAEVSRWGLIATRGGSGIVVMGSPRGGWS
eukprot:jgi/Mesen1/10776/ME000091S10299